MKRALYSLALFFALLVVVTLARHGLGRSPSTTTSTTSTSTSVVSTTTVPTSTTTTAPANPTTCLGSDFHAAGGYFQGATGTIQSWVTLTKATSGTCVLEGWPRLMLVSPTGALVASNVIAEPSQTTPFTFTDAAGNAAPVVMHVTSGASVRFDFAFTDVPAANGASCPSVGAIRVGTTAGPGLTTASTYTFTPCSGGRLLVSPFFPVGS